MSGAKSAAMGSTPGGGPFAGAGTGDGAFERLDGRVGGIGGMSIDRPWFRALSSWATAPKPSDRLKNPLRQMAKMRLRIIALVSIAGTLAKL